MPIESGPLKLALSRSKTMPLRQPTATPKSLPKHELARTPPRTTDVMAVFVDVLVRVQGKAAVACGSLPVPITPPGLPDTLSVQDPFPNPAVARPQRALFKQLPEFGA